MANVTVCIPAYRSEKFIDSTLRSVLAQTYSDFVVEIAIEPPAEQILNACGPFLRDKRIRTIVNPQVLGWAENIKNLVRRVATPYFLILPHDDLLEPDYIAALLDELTGQPQASVAYTDMDCFGAASFSWRLLLTEMPIFDRLMSFFLGGMEAVPMRGLTRSSVGDFPTDRYDGFAVECEWVLHLLISGPGLRVPRPLYLKRILDADEISASAKRLLGRSRKLLFEALEGHRSRILALIHQADLPKTQRDTIELAAEAAMLRRHMTFPMGAFHRVQLARARQIMIAADTMPGSYGKRIQAMTLLAMSHHELIEGNTRAAQALAIAAVDADSSQWEGLAHLSRLQLDAGRSIDAFDAAMQAWTLEPHARGLRVLIKSIVLQMMTRSGQAAMLAERFNAAAYLTDYPDVAAAGMDPWRHYRKRGWREGRNVRLLRVNDDTRIADALTAMALVHSPRLDLRTITDILFE